ncbi:hypothetical protein NKDENANG_02084 [Candidatus Entotheonellaceae bacterium PAL068K]
MLYQCISTHQQYEPGPRCIIGSAFQEIEAQINAALRHITLAALATRVQDGSKEVQWLTPPTHDPQQANDIRLCSF